MAKRQYFEDGKIVGKRGIRGWGLHFGASASVGVLNLVLSLQKGRGCGVNTGVSCCYLGCTLLWNYLISLTASEANMFWSSSSVILVKDTSYFLLWYLSIHMDMNPLSTKS